MLRKISFRLISGSKSLLLALLFIVIWELISLSGIFNSLLFPSPVSVFYRLGELFWGLEIAADLGSTLLKIGIALAAGSLSGVALGILVSRCKFVYNAASPLIDFFRSIPATALFPLFLLFFGIGDPTIIALATWICLLYLSLHVSKGIMGTSETSLIIAKTLKKSEMETLRNVRLKEALPMIFVGFRTAVSLTTVVVIVTEMFVGTTAGLGKAIIDAAYTYDIPKLYAIIFIVGVVGYLLNYLIIKIERKVVHWQGK